MNIATIPFFVWIAFRERRGRLRSRPVQVSAGFDPARCRAGGWAETNFRQALRTADGSLITFIEKPIKAAMLAIGVLILLGPVATACLRKKLVA